MESQVTFSAIAEDHKAEILSTISLELIRPVSLNAKLNNILHLIYVHFKLTHTMLLLPDGDVLTVFASRGYPASGIGATVKIGQGITGVVAERKQKLKLNNLSWKKQYFKAAIGDHVSLIPMPGLPNAESQLAIPLLNDGVLIAVFAAESEKLDLLTPDDESFLMNISQLIGLSIQNTLLIDRLETAVSERTKKLQLQKKRLQHMNQSKDRLFTLIAHDLKSPVAALKQTSAVMNAYYNAKDVPGILKTSERIVNAADELGRALDSLLKWSITQTGNIKISLRSFNIKSLLNEVLRQYRSEWRAKSLNIYFTGNSDNRVFSDRQACKSIISNFLHNAIKFSHPGNGINISFVVTGPLLEMKIQDFGTGIPQSKLRSFKKNAVNVSTKGTYSEIGTGLGIATSMWLALQVNVSIDIKSSIGKGTVVSIKMPLYSSRQLPESTLNLSDSLQ